MPLWLRFKIFLWNLEQPAQMFHLTLRASLPTCWYSASPSTSHTDTVTPSYETGRAEVESLSCSGLGLPAFPDAGSEQQVTDVKMLKPTSTSLKRPCLQVPGGSGPERHGPKATAPQYHSSLKYIGRGPYGRCCNWVSSHLPTEQ